MRLQKTGKNRPLPHKENRARSVSPGCPDNIISLFIYTIYIIKKKDFSFFIYYLLLPEVSSNSTSPSSKVFCP